MLETDVPKYIDVLQKKIELVGTLDEAQRQRLTEIASRCPVHKTLITDTIIETELLS